MTSYTKHNWVNGEPPNISAANLIEMDTALEEVVNNAVDKRDFNAKGDLLVGSGDNAYGRLPVGANDYVLIADSTQTLGVKWGPAVLSYNFTIGSVLFSGGGNVVSQDNANLFWDNTNKRLGIGTSTPSVDLSFGGNAARTIWMERDTTAATAGQALVIQAGGAYSGGTNLSGGSLYLDSGISTGTGSSNIIFQTATAGTSGTADRTPTTKVTIPGSGGIMLHGSTSGTITLLPAAVAGTNTITLPASTGTALTTASKAAYTDINTGADDALFVTSLSLKSSYIGKRNILLKIIDDGTTLTTGTPKMVFMAPVELNGFILKSADAFVSTASTSGAITVQIYSVRYSRNMLSGAITINRSGFTTHASGSSGTVDLNYDDIVTGDLIYVNVLASGTGAKGLGINLMFQLP